MADAADPFRISMFSMSFGLRSARRLTTWSCDDDWLPLDREIDASPPPIDAFEMMMPSTT